MGHGKSKAARIASCFDRDNDLSRDCVAIMAKEGSIYGRFDPGALGEHHNSNSLLHQFYKIDYIVYCLSPEQTAEVFKLEKRKIRSCDSVLMSKLSVIYPYPAYTAQSVFSKLEMVDLADPLRRSIQFHDVIISAEFDNLFLIPFMDSTEEKAKLYSEF